MNRSDRLSALVEELREVSPRPRGVEWLARRFGVSARTVERDLAALRQAGLPVRAEPAGYALTPSTLLPPLTLTAEEATALAVALPRLAGTPFAGAARTALGKVRAVLPERELAAADEAANQLVFLGGSAPAPVEPVVSMVPATMQRAVAARRLLRLDYADRHGVVTERLVEPLGFLGGHRWYLVGWCRLRGAVRGFRFDRVQGFEVLDETFPTRHIDRADLDSLGARLLASRS